MPIRSPRQLYEVERITRNLDDDPNAIDQAPSQTVDGQRSNIFVKIKKAIGDYLGMEPILWSDPRLLGVFQGEGLNKGAEFERRIGGFRHASYRLVAKSVFLLQEEYWDKENKVYVVQQAQFRTMTIGFPKGHSVHEFKTFLSDKDNFENIAAFVTPNGRKIDLYNG